MTCSHTLVLIELGLHILQRLNSSKQTGCVVWCVLVHLVIFKEVGPSAAAGGHVLLMEQTSASF